ncbi:MAG: efflux RND transporter periplasmic adaptor subunit, partial [Verrucomicrobiota bacterium]
VEPNGHLAEIIDLSEVYAEITLFEGQVSRVVVGMPIRVTVESFPERLFEGTIALLSGKLDPETRSLKAYAKLSNPEKELRPHMRGTGHIVVEKLDAVIGISHRAVTGDPGNLSVFVQTDDHGLEYEQRPIVLGMEDDRYVEIIEGVLPAEQVVVSGNYQLQFVENKSAIPAGGGHGHDHGPGGEHLTEEEGRDGQGKTNHGERDHDAHHTGKGHLGSPLTLVLGVGLVLSVGLNFLLLFLKKPTIASA